MLLNLAVGGYSWESLGLQRDQIIHPKGNQPWIFIGRTDAEAETPIFWPPDAKNWLIGKDPDAGKDGRQEEKGTTDGWMASLTQWTWVWASSGNWWWTGRPGVLQSMGSQRVGHDWATELNWIDWQLLHPPLASRPREVLNWNRWRCSKWITIWSFYYYTGPDSFIIEMRLLLWFKWMGTLWESLTVSPQWWKVLQTVKRLPTMWETQVRSLGWEDPLEKEMATHSSTLAWKIHGRRSPVDYSPWGPKELDTTERLHFHFQRSPIGLSW